ncbi:hypothetical protein STEG23_026290 [Scotinomys teguina]
MHANVQAQHRQMAAEVAVPYITQTSCGHHAEGAAAAPYRELNLEVPPPLMFPITVTPLGRDQDCSLKNREPLGSWILEVGARPPRLDCTSSSLESVPCPFASGDLDSETHFLNNTLLEYIDLTRQRLEAENEKDSVTLKDIQCHFSALVANIIQNVPIVVLIFECRELRLNCALKMARVFTSTAGECSLGIACPYLAKAAMQESFRMRGPMGSAHVAGMEWIARRYLAQSAGKGKRKTLCTINKGPGQLLAEESGVVSFLPGEVVCDI